MSAPQFVKGQKALVTGASSGIGKNVAIYLAQKDADVIVNYIGAEDDANQIVATIKARGGHAIAIRADVSKEDEVQAMFMADVGEFRHHRYSGEQCRPAAGRPF